jgi:hypothetical protein
VQWRCPAFVMTHCVDLFGSSCLKTGHDYGVQKDCHKHDLIAETPPSLSDRIECVVRLKAIARLQIKLRRCIASAWSHDRNRGLSSWSSRNTIGIKPSITFPSLNFCHASSASEEFIGCECTITKSSREAPSLRIHAMINWLVIFMR